MVTNKERRKEGSRVEISCVEDDVEKSEHLCTVNGNVKLCSHYETEKFPQNIKYELPYDPVISLLRVYTQKNIQWNLFCSTGV
jgi:hypothetical protein